MTGGESWATGSTTRTLAFVLELACKGAIVSNPIPRHAPDNVRLRRRGHWWKASSTPARGGQVPRLITSSLGDGLASRRLFRLIFIAIHQCGTSQGNSNVAFENRS